MSATNNDYYLGLDVGTNSVGYAVTDENYNPLFFRRKRMLGVSLFSEAALKADRRSFRSGRRRLRRRQQRVELIQELFAHEIAKVDERFYIRLKESQLWLEDKSSPRDNFLLFNDASFTDKKYYVKYPTIHHLIMDLIEDDSPKDVRLVYLALAWLVKYRGHFLSSMGEDSINILDDFKGTFADFINYLKENGNLELVVDPAKFREALKKETGVKQKKTLFSDILNTKELKKRIVEESDSDNPIAFDPDAIVALLSGGKADLKKLFLLKSDEYAELSSISLEQSREDLELAIHEIGDDAELISLLKSLYDWKELVNMLGEEGAKYISASKKSIYDQHKQDLINLKYLVLKCTDYETYKKIFKASAADNNYAAYAYNSNDRKHIAKKASPEDFYKFLKTEVSKIRPLKEYQSFYEDMLHRIDLGTFLPKQKTKNNNVIPYQLHLNELKAILTNAEKYLPFLTVKDKDGLSVSDKIIATFKFRIPYYVGVLNKKSEFSWVIRTNEKIYPWNINEVVDRDTSEEEFINRMIGRCTYLPVYNVLPKHSLLYQKFELLNEINNLQINSIPISVDLKQRLYTDLFLVRKNISRKNILDYIISNEGTGEYLLTGIDDKIKSSLRTYHDFKRLLTSGTLNEGDVETIVKRISSTTDRARLAKWVEKNYPHLSEDDQKYITRLKYKDYGRLSREFLNKFEGANRETGELYTIITAIWETNDNLMQLLSDRYTFKEKSEEIVNEMLDQKEKSLDEKMDDLYLSNPVKRQIRKTTDIVNEIVKIQKQAPKKIFVEMARGATKEQMNKRTKSRRAILEDLYKNVQVDVRDIAKELADVTDNQLQSNKLYLYFTQLGKCAYTNKTINLQALIEGTKEFDIDHIWPQSAVKDDSLENTVLSDSYYNEHIKKNIYPVRAEERNAKYAYWKMLHDSKLIGDVKFNRLTRSKPFTDDELWGFINRQLVETRQSTKALTLLLKEKYPDTEIVFVKAGLVAEYRQEYNIVKSRIVNDLHHAKDAYLNIVVGNVYHEKFTRSWFLKNKAAYSIKLSNLFKWELKKGDKIIWAGDKELNRIKKEAHNNNIQLVSNPYTKTGGFYDQMPLKAGENLMVRKTHLPTEKYGGYAKATSPFFLLVKFAVNKKTEVMFVPIDAIAVNRLENDLEFKTEYIKNIITRFYTQQIEIENIEILLNGKKIKIDTIISLDGYRSRTKGKTGPVNDTRLSLAPFTNVYYKNEDEHYIKRIEGVVKKTSQNTNLVINENYDKVSAEDNTALYDVILNKYDKYPFNNRPNNGLKTLIEGRASFIEKSKDLNGQLKTLMSMISIMASSSGPVDLSFINGKEKSCAYSINIKLSNLKKNYQSITLIEQSPTGLFEKKSKNLLEFL